MKKAKRLVSKRTAHKAVLILMTVFLLLGIFVACGGLPASTESEEKTWDMDELPEIQAPPEIQIPTYKPPDFPESTETEKETTPTVIYAASRESNKYHRTSCRYVDNILTENLIFFYSKDSAHRAGYSPCSVCSP